MGLCHLVHCSLFDGGAKGKPFPLFRKYRAEENSHQRSWGSDGYLYTTGHDHAKAYVLEVDKTNKLNYVRIEKDVGFVGQAIAWDRFSEKPILWGIVGNKHVSLALIPGKKKQP